jgi:hypothetical protein
MHYECSQHGCSVKYEPLGLTSVFLELPCSDFARLLPRFLLLSRNPVFQGRQELELPFSVKPRSKIIFQSAIFSMDIECADTRNMRAIDGFQLGPHTFFRFAPKPSEPFLKYRS